MFFLVLLVFSCGPVPSAPAPLAKAENRPLTITTLALPEAHVGSFYTAQLSASGGAKPYSWSVVAGKLPEGLTLNAQTGAVTGTPAEPATASFTVRVADSSLLAQQRSLATLDVQVGDPLFRVVTDSLPTGYPGFSYWAQLAAEGGKPPYTWAIIEGSLPTGLEIDPLTGVITGIPVSEGAFVFTIEATDSSSPPSTALVRLASPLPAAR